jgi:nitroreductase
MDVSAALRNRRTVRAFLDRPVPRETVDVILEDALRTPSWANTQPWEIWVAGGEALERIRRASMERTQKKVPSQPDLPFPGGWPEACRERTKQLTSGRAAVAGTTTDDPAFHRDFLEANRRFFGAPCVVYLCMDRSLGQWSVFDLGALSQSIMLAAQERGVDSAEAINLVCYPDLLRAELGIPDHLLIVIGIGLGYVDPEGPEDAFRSERSPLADVVRFVGL